MRSCTICSELTHATYIHIVSYIPTVLSHHTGYHVCQLHVKSCNVPYCTCTLTFHCVCLLCDVDVMYNLTNELIIYNIVGVTTLVCYQL